MCIATEHNVYRDAFFELQMRFSKGNFAVKAKPMAALTLEEKRDWAQYLYTEAKLNQKEVANKVGVSQKTIGEWKEKYMWEDLRKSLLTTRKEQLAILYNQLDAITGYIRDHQNNIPDSKQSDSILKITAAIKNLETEFSIGDVYEIGKRFISHIQTIDYEKSKELVDYYDSFIKHCLATN